MKQRDMWWFRVLMLLPCWVMAQNYCSVCQDHTMCKYQGSGPTCGSNEESGVSKAEIQQILKLHNDFRAKVATGMEHRGYPGPQPSAANMQELIWDDNMAAVAQKWADQCMFQHDACRDDPRFQVGQNMYFSSGFSKVDWTRAVSAWYEEVVRFDSQTVDRFNLQSGTGHYTQLIWGNTRYVGCGRVTYGGAYRLEGYQRMEYVLSPSPRNDSVINTEDENRRGFDIRPDIDDIPTTVSDLLEDWDEQATNPPTTTRLPGESNPEQNIVEIYVEKAIPITFEIKEEQTTKLSTTSEALEETSSSGTKTAASTEKYIPTTPEIKEEKTTKISTTNQALEANRPDETTIESPTEKVCQITSEAKELEKPTKKSPINKAAEKNRSGETAIETSTEKVCQITSETKEFGKITKATTTNQATEDRSGETATESFIEKVIPITHEMKKEKPTKLALTTQTLEENHTGEITTKNSIGNLGQLISEDKETPPIKNSSSQNPKFSIFIPGYWISNSERDSKGQVVGSSQSMDSTAPGDSSTFTKETPSVGALKIATWDPVHGRWNLKRNQAAEAENPARIQVNRWTQRGWVRSTYDNLGRDQILICNYGSAGNYLNQPIYVRGKPCSRCPLGSVCRNGLCA